MATNTASETILTGTIVAIYSKRSKNPQPTHIGPFLQESEANIYIGTDEHAIVFPKHRYRIGRI